MSLCNLRGIVYKGTQFFFYRVAHCTTYLSLHEQMFIFFSGRAKIGGKKKTKEKFEIYFFHVLSFFFPEKRLWRPTSKKLLVFFFSQIYGPEKKTRPTYLYSQKSAQKQCATPEIKKLSAFVVYKKIYNGLIIGWLKSSDWIVFII